MRLSELWSSSIESVQGPLLFVDNIPAARMGEIVTVVYPDGARKEGEILKIDNDRVMIQVFGENRGLDVGRSAIIFSDMVKEAPLSLGMLGRIFDGSFRPVDGSPMFIPESFAPVTGSPMNPVSRGTPAEFIETGLSVVDGLNTLVKGQKLPIFSCAGLPSREIAAHILRHARAGAETSSGGGSDFVIVFVALGLTHHEYAFYMKTLQEIATSRVSFINLADDSVVERLLAPRFGLTAAEFLAFEKGYDVLVLIADMTNYCDALREVSTAREELPGRRGYPGYMYSDLASLYERAGRIRGKTGSVTMVPVITMPEDDITHPIPDLSGYITEGQIVLGRELHRQGIFPPVDVLPSLSRLMQRGIGEGRTRKDHRGVANLVYKHYAKGRDLRSLEAIVGRDGLMEKDVVVLDFAESFEREFVHQEGARRTIGETLDKATELMDRYGLGQ